MPERNRRQRNTFSFSGRGLDSQWGCLRSAFISVDVLTNSRTTLNIQAAPTRVGAGHQRSHTGSHAITATVLNIKENLNISAHRSRELLFIYKSQTWVRRWAHNLGGGRVMQCFWGVLKHVAQMCASTRKSCWSAAAASVPPYRIGTSWFWFRYQKGCRNESGFSGLSISSYRTKQKLLAFLQQTAKSWGYPTTAYNNISKKHSTKTTICN